MSKEYFKILRNKNLLVEKKIYFQILLEILTIVAIFLALLYIKPKNTEQEVKGHKDIKLDDLSEFSKLLSLNANAIPYKLYFTPKNGTETIFKKTAEKLHLLEAVGFDNEKSMIEKFNDSEVFACVILQGHDITLRFPNYFRTRPYTHYYNLNDFWLTRSTGGNDDSNMDFYIREGFLQLLYTIVQTQMEVENSPMAAKFPAIISSLFNNTKPKVDCVNGISNEPFSPEGFLKWSLYYFIFFVPFINLLKKISREYEENIFSRHSIYGFTYNIHRRAHLSVSLIHFILLDVVILIGISFVWPSLKKFYLLSTFLVVFNIVLIVYAITLSAFFKNAKTAVWCGVTLWIFSYAAFLEILYTSHFNILRPKIFIAAVLFINNVFPNGLMKYFEETEEKPSREIYMFIGVQIHILAFFFFLLYVKDLFYENKLKMVTEKLKCKKFCMELKPKIDEKHFEYGPLKGGTLHLTNVYSYCDHVKEKIQLKNISMRFIKNEISVILGPRNSGKTCFIGILAGWEKHQGRITYLGHDINEDWEHYIQHVDVSIAKNAIFDYLTIEETLEYFILIKHTADFQLKEELSKWLHIIRPLANGQKLVKALSFSEKRILDLCCTLACNTAVVLLDEPTEHMRLEEQMMYWDILKKEKQNRIIIVTTVNVDEANEIGDRIGILNDGCLLAWGSSYFLKSNISAQVFLVCFHESKADIRSITDIIEKYIPDVQIQKYLVGRIIYTIPPNKKPILQRLLIELEKDFSTLGITKLYVVGSGLNEVYMSLTTIPKIKANPPNMRKTLNVVNNQKISLRRRVIEALMYKKVLCQSRNPLPISLIFISFFVILLFNHISPARFNTKSIMFSGNDLLNNYGKILEVSNVDDIVAGSFFYENNYVTNSSTKGGFESLAGLEVNDDSSVSVWFNERIFHSAPLALNLAFNYLSHGGTYINKPIVIQSNYDIHVILGTIMPLTMSAVFVHLQDERSSSMLRLQKIARVSEKSRWTLTFIWDYFIFLLIATLYLIILIVFVIVKPTLLIAAAALTLFILGGLASLFFIYLVYLYLREDNALRAFLKIFLIQISLGLLPYVIFTNFLLNTSKILFVLLMLLPGFSVLHGTTKIFDNNQNLDFHSYLQLNNPGILDSVICMVITFFIYFTTFISVIIYRRAYSKSTPPRVKQLASVCYPYDDERVVKEKVRISNMSIEACKTQIILVDQLESSLPKKGNRVNTISFGLNNYCCLGIYGSNHSGKTHIIKQLVGEEGFWFGEVYIGGYNIKKYTAKALKHVGYCPQERGFNSLLTPTELLKFFLILYGIRESNLLEQLTHLSMSLQLRGYMNTKIGNLPQNIKRRINLAAALIARKKILIFDEPTRGLPAYDRLLIWNILRFCRSMNNTIIFTTSESLELKELADYVVTVNEGEMISYDNPHNLEYYYNIGFYIEIKLYADGLTLEEVEENINMDVENLNRFVRIFHEESELIYRCDCVVKYYIPVENVLYSYIFGVMEKHRHRLNIADYSLGSLSLNGVLRMLRKCRKEKRRFERAPLNVLKDPKTLPRRN